MIYIEIEKGNTKEEERCILDFIKGKMPFMFLSYGISYNDLIKQIQRKTRLKVFLETLLKTQMTAHEKTIIHKLIYDSNHINNNNYL